MSTPTAEPAAVPVLDGEWKQSNSSDDTSFQTATVQGDVITILWNDTAQETTALYWAGSFQQPTAPGSYTFESVNDAAQTESAMLASTDPTKTITFDGRSLSYSVSAFGVTKTVRLEHR